MSSHMVFIILYCHPSSRDDKSQDPDEYVRLRQDFQSTTMVQYANYFEAKIKANNNRAAATLSNNHSSSYIVGSSLTMADLILQGMVQAVESGSWDHIDKHFFDAFPGIM